jgi:hypothetical protein
VLVSVTGKPYLAAQELMSYPSRGYLAAERDDKSANKWRISGYLART